MRTLKGRFRQFAATLLIVLLIVGCGTAAPAAEAEPEPTATSASTETPTAQSQPAPESYGVASFINARSLEDLVDKSTLIVIVTVGDGYESSQVGGQTAAGDPDPRFSTLMGFHDVTVESYLKGSGPDAFTVARSEEKHFHNPERPASMARTSVWRNPVGPLEAGARYMLFMHPYERFENTFVTTVEPARWRLDGGTATPESPSDTAIYLFEERTEQQLRAQVIEALSPADG